MTDEEIAKALNDLKELSMTNYYGDTYFAEQAGTKLALKYIEKLQKENQELKEDNSHQWKERCRLTFELGKLQKENQELKGENIILEGNKIGLKLAIQELKEKIENEIKELEENEYFYREHNRMYEYEGKINLLKRLLVKE